MASLLALGLEGFDRGRPPRPRETHELAHASLALQLYDFDSFGHNFGGQEGTVTESGAGVSAGDSHNDFSSPVLGELSTQVG
jgi:hypothetical protein